MMLTEKQHQLLMFIYQYQQEKGISPSFEEMRHALQIKSKSGIHSLIESLVGRGYLRRLPNRARALKVLQLPTAPRGDNVKPMGLETVDRNAVLPLYGQIAAGLPLETFNNPDDMITVPTAFLQGDAGDHFALRVIGSSMKDAGILDQDIAILKKCAQVSVGTVVAALIDSSEITLKRWYVEEGQVVLAPANADFIPQVFDPSRVQLQGKLVNIVRSYGVFL